MAMGIVPIEGSERRHHDRPETHETGFANGIERGFARPLSDKREVDHHDGVLLDDTDQHQDADDRDDAEVVAEQLERRECACGSRRQPGQDGQRVDEALVEDSQHDIDRQDRRADKQALIGERLLEYLGSTGEARRDGLGTPSCVFSVSSSCTA